MIESKLSEMLAAKAGGFSLPPLLPERVLRRTRARRARQAGALALLTVALSAATATALRVPSDQRAFAAFTFVDQKRASADEDGTPPPSHRHDGTGAPLTLSRLLQHVQCMRAHGVNVLDPQRTADGWTIPVSEPPFRNERAFRNALFVDCRLENVTENLVLGGRSQAYIEKLMACTKTRGFILPPPTKDASGQFQFDLDKATPTWGSDAWSRRLRHLRRPVAGAVEIRGRVVSSSRSSGAMARCLCSRRPPARVPPDGVRARPTAGSHAAQLVRSSCGSALPSGRT